MITKDIDIEELIDTVPEAITYLMRRGIRCIACGEPIWGTLEAAARQKGFDDAQISQFVEDINRMEEAQ